MKVASLVHNNFIHDSRVQKQAISLANAGYDLTVLAIWKKGILQEEINDGFKISRFRIYSSFLVGTFGKLVNFVEFSLKVSWHIRKMDIVHCHDYHPLPSLLISKLFLRSKFFVIYDAHEFESQKLGFGKFSKITISFLEKISSRFVDGFITVSKSILEEYKQHFSNIPNDLILNCPKIEILLKCNKFESLFSLRKGSVKCLYQGGFIPFRGITELLEASIKSSLKDVNFIFMGDGGMTQAGRNLEKQIVKMSKSHENIYHVKSVPIKELLAYTSSATVGCVLTIDNCLNHKYSLPNKFFEYAMAGLPVLVSDLPELRKLVEQYDCGVVCKSVTPEGVVKGLKKLLDQDLEKLGKNARKSLLKN